MNERDKYIHALREMADWLEINPEVPVGEARFDVYVADKLEAQAIVRKMGRAEKKAYGDLFWVRKSFGPIYYDVNLRREDVCERVVVGTKVVPAQPERVIPATPELHEDVVEWRCGTVMTAEKIVKELPEEQPASLQPETVGL